MNTKTLIGFVLVIVILGGAAYFVGRPPSGPEGPPPPTGQQIEQHIDQNWKTLLSATAGPPRGNPKAPWTLVECGDFECPNCGKSKPVIEKFIDQSNGKIKLYFVNFPIQMLHKHAEKAAEASLAAGAQGKFWQMYDMLYNNQDALMANEIESRAASIPGLNAKQFTDDLKSGKYAPAVEDEENTVAKSGIDITPTFLLRSSSGGKVYAFMGLQEDPKTHQPSLNDLVRRPPWIYPPGAKKTTAVAAKPSGA